MRLSHATRRDAYDTAVRARVFTWAPESMISCRWTDHRSRIEASGLFILEQLG